METGIEKAQRINRERRELGEKIEVENNLIKKAKKHPESLKKAIGAMCFACFGGDELTLPDSGWKKAIATCTAPDCPLYPHRPYKNISADNDNDAGDDQD